MKITVVGAAAKPEEAHVELKLIVGSGNTVSLKARKAGATEWGHLCHFAPTTRKSARVVTYSKRMVEMGFPRFYNMCDDGEG